jgi:hypothetical protein
VIRRLFNVLTMASFLAFLFFALATVSELAQVADGTRYYYHVDVSHGRVVTRDAAHLAMLHGSLAGLACVFPIVAFARWRRNRRMNAPGFPIEPAHKKTADVTAVQGTTRSAEISN